MLRLLINSVCIVLALAIMSGCSGLQRDTSKVADASPNVPPAVLRSYQQALDEMRNGENGRAIAAFEAFIIEYPGYSAAYLNLAKLQLRTDQSDAAIATLETAMLVEPSYAPAYNQLGIIYREQGQFESADTAYRAAIAANPDYALAYLNLGVLNDLYLQQPQVALVYYQQYRDRLPADADTAALDRWIADLQRRTASVDAGELKQ